MINYNSCNAYFRSLKKKKYLSKEKEQELFRLYKEENSLKARNEIIETNIRFVLRVALNYKSQPLPFRDLFNEGVMGLIRAIESFDYTRNLKFITYAVWWIRAYINRAIHEQSHIVKPPVKEKNECEKPVSLDVAVKSEDRQKLTIKDMLSDDKFKEIETSIENKKLRKIIKIFFSGLSDKEGYVLTKIYGLDGHPMTLETIGMHLNVVRERVRQIKEKALRKLQRKYKLESCSGNKEFYDELHLFS